MKILAVSNLYPPHYVGGYELGCRDVLEGLRARGHEVHVLTSQYGVEKPVLEPTPYPVARLLRANIPSRKLRFTEFLSRVVLLERFNQRTLKEMCARVQPDILYFWNLGGLSYSLVPLVRTLGLPTSFYVSDDWPLRRKNDRLCRLMESLLRVPGGRALLSLWRRAGLELPDVPTKLAHAQFTSCYMKEAITGEGVACRSADVIPWGVRLEDFPYRASGRTGRLLYVGQLVPHKGVHTLTAAFRHLIGTPEGASVTLTIAGGTSTPEYVDSLRAEVVAADLTERITFTGPLPRQRLPELYQQHDILLFPSIWEEPFSITLLEAMASGLAVVSTLTGGTPEILQNEVNGLTFPKEDADACAAQILRYLREETLYERLRKQARCHIEERFQLATMVEQIEQSLQRAAAA